MNVFEIFASLSLDSSEYDKELDKAGKKGNNFASSLTKGLVKGTTIAIGAAATGISFLTKEAVSAYGDYEQLVGGVETLFGAGGRSLEEYADYVGMTVDEASADYNRLINAQEMMLDNANQAFMTSGLSANDYMETVTSFSASLIQSLGGDTVTAAEMADMAIIDMADNANKMGTSMESIQNAYAGFAKQNYTMLDNLKLGYGGTKTEMERLILDAEALSDSWEATRDENGNLTMSYADVVEAIHLVQENMGIAGTTAREANETIQGSLSAMSAAWANLLTGLADPDADIGILIDNMVQTAGVALGNLVPTVSRALSGIGAVIAQLAPVIARELPTLINDLLPPLLEAAVTLVTAIAENLPAIMSVISDVLPELINSLVQAAIELAPMLITVGIEFLGALGSALIENAPTLMPQIAQLVSDLLFMLTQPDNLAMMLEGAYELIVAMTEGLFAAAPILFDALGQTLANLIVMISENGGYLFDYINEFLLEVGQHIIDALQEWLGLSDEEMVALLEGVQEWIDNTIESVSNFFSNITSGFKSAFNGIKSFLSGIWNFLKSLFTGGFSSILSTSNSTLGSIFNKFTDKFEGIKKLVGDAIDWLIGAFKFDWNLPKIKLPHISVTGGVAPYGIGGAGSLPSFDIKWYKKAYDDAYILNDATIFGAANGKYLGGGEGNGSEAIVGTELLMNMMQTVVRNEISSLNFGIYLDGKTLVGGIAPRMDDELGRLSNLGMRGAY